MVSSTAVAPEDDGRQHSLPRPTAAVSNLTLSDEAKFENDAGGEDPNEKEEKELLIDPTGACAASCCRMCTFLVVNAVLLFYIFSYPDLTAYKHWKGRPSVTEAESRKGPYHLTWDFSSPSNRIDLDVTDAWDGPSGTEALLSSYADNVFIGSDRDGDPGWNLQDIVDLPRYARNDPQGEFSSDAIGGRGVQDYRVTKEADCGTLAPQVTSHWSEEKGACYLNRLEFLAEADGDWAARYGPSCAVAGGGEDCEAAAGSMGGFGMPGPSTMMETRPSDSHFLCSMGRRRATLTDITINTKGCRVQIHSTEGDGYHLWVKQKGVKSITMDIRKPVSVNETTGCRSNSLVIDLVNPACPFQSVPGVDPSCEDDCHAVLFKGIRARRIPIAVAADTDTSAPVGSLHVVDRHLVLDHGQGPAPWEAAGPPDLSVSGGKIHVTVAGARIRHLSANTQDGEMRFDHARFDSLNLKSSSNNINIEDDRDLELRYRSAAQYLCLAAPAVEDIPGTFPGVLCEMDPEGAPHKAAHIFYDTIADGEIDRGEFIEGMRRLGLDFEADSLDMNEQQQQALFDRVFSYNNPHAAVQAMTYDLFQTQLEILAPYFTTLYDSSERRTCASECQAVGSLTVAGCSSLCNWACTDGAAVGRGEGGGVNPSNDEWAECDVTAGCTPMCGNPDTSIDGYGTEPGQIDYHYYDVDPPDGIITYQEMRQALLKIYSNCTYVIEPNEASFATCRYVGGGQFDMMESGELRRECKSYDGGEYDANTGTWRWDNEGLAGLSVPHSGAGVVPRECRPFPDYDPKLSGVAYDPSCTAAQCFLPDGTRAPPQYYNRTTWSSANMAVVVSMLNDIFSDTSNFNYFNISDDDQYRKFGSKMFAQTVIRDRVPYDVFNNNLQSLHRVAGVGENYYLFNPSCYRGKFMKVRPTWGPGMNDEQLEGALIKYKDAQPETVENTNMPLYVKNVDAFDPKIECMDGRACDASGRNPCPHGYGDGTPMSATEGHGPRRRPFRYERYLPYGDKWGLALPPHCLDEAWPDGGEGGFYPDRPEYGVLAGKPIVPGCEPVTCKPLVKANVIEGSVHAQVLPFAFDWRNETGQYRSMVDNCTLPDGTDICFFKGYDSSKDDRLRRADAGKFADLQDKYTPKTSGEDVVVSFDVRGPGVPTFSKWFWTSRKVYMEMEPAWLSVMSGGVLTPTLLHISALKTPGYCVREMGAVERVDWRNNETYGIGVGSTLGLRMSRHVDTYNSLYGAMIPPDEQSLRGAFVIKNVWRAAFPNETFYYSGSTADPAIDTYPGYVDPVTGDAFPPGPQWRHHRRCSYPAGSDGTVPDNCESAITYPDNCHVPRDCVRDPATGECVRADDGAFTLTECRHEDGTVAYLNEVLRERGPTFNETSFAMQFARGMELYPYTETLAMTGSDVEEYTALTLDLHRRTLNVSELFYDKLLVGVSPSGDYSLKDYEYAWVHQNVSLFLTVLFSIIIAAMCGVVGSGIVIWLSAKKLDEFNVEIADAEKVLHMRRTSKRRMLVDRWKLFMEQQAKDEMAAMGVDLRASRSSTASRESQGVDTVPEIFHVSDMAAQKIVHFTMANGWQEKGGKHVGDWDVQVMFLKLQRARQEEGFCPEDDSADDTYAPKVGDLLGDLAKNSLAARVAAKGNAKLRKMKREAGNTLPVRLLTAALKIGLAIAEKGRRIFSLRFPSPFEVITLVVRGQLRKRLVNSLKTFVQVRCIRNRELQDEDELRLGGSLADLHYIGEDLAGVRVTRMGIDSEVGFARTVYGRTIKYRVKWVKIKVSPPQDVDIVDEEGNQDDEQVSQYRDLLESWEKDLPEEVQHPSEEGRRYILPSATSASGEGGCQINMVIQGHGGTRTVSVSTLSLHPTVELKTIMRNFAPSYEQFCMENDLTMRNILKSEELLHHLGVKISKRLQPMVKGLRLKNKREIAEARRAKAARLAEEAEAKMRAAAVQEGKLTVEIPVSCRVAGGTVMDLSLNPSLVLDRSTAGHLAVYDSPNPKKLPPVGTEGVSTSAPASSRGGDDAAVASGASPGGEEEGQEGEDDGAHPPDEFTPIGQVGGYSSGSKNVLNQKMSSAKTISAAVGRTISRADRESELEEPAPVIEDSDDEEDKEPPFLEVCDWPVAQFLRAQYTITNSYAKDYVSYPVFKQAYIAWCKRQLVRPVEIEPESLGMFELKYEERPFYDLFGISVNETPQTESVASANKPMFFALNVATVIAHVLFVWFLPYPLVYTCMAHQGLYSGTTAIAPQFTTEMFRSDVWTFLDLEIPLENKVTLWICFSFCMFGTFKLVIYYTCYKYDQAKWRTAIKSLFYIHMLLIVAMMFSLLFMVFTWLILGAVIKPDAFLPYAVGTITLLAHSKATWSRLMGTFNNYRNAILATVAAAFSAKLAASLAMSARKKQGGELLNDDNKLDVKDIQPYPVFKIYADKDDQMSYQEFGMLLERFDIDMIEDKRKLLFARVDSDGSGMINYSEFEAAWKFLQEEIAVSHMNESGITKTKLVMVFAYAVLVLCLVLAFIFLGVAAFVGGGTLGAIVNSSLTAFSGGAMNAQQSEEDPADDSIAVEL